MFVSDYQKQPFRAGLEKPLLKFMQIPWKIHVKEFAVLVKLQARNLKRNLTPSEVFLKYIFLILSDFYDSFESQKYRFTRAPVNGCFCKVKQGSLNKGNQRK